MVEDFEPVHEHLDQCPGFDHLDRTRSDEEKEKVLKNRSDLLAG